MDGDRLSSVVLSNRTGDSGHRLQHRKFHIKMGKNFFTLRVTERELVESSSLEIFRTTLDTFLCNLLKATRLSRGIGLDDH